MEPNAPFSADAGGKEAVFRATYEALLRHGYADLSIQRIADEGEMSKSTVYHHFDSKADLLLAFSERLLMQRAEEIVLETDADPLTILTRVFDLVFLGEARDGTTLADFTNPDLNRIYLELRAQAVHDPEYRDHFDSLDGMMREFAAELVREGIDAGIFREVDPEAVAATVYLLFEGGLMLKSTTDDESWLPAVRREVDRYLAQLVREDHEETDWYGEFEP